MKLYFIPNWLRKYLSKEDFLTIQCSNFLKAKQLLFHHTFNEGKRSRTMQSKFKGFGVLTGIPDLLVFEPKGEFHGMAVELKVKYENGSKNYPTPSQKEAMKLLSQRGWKCVVVWDFDTFQAEIENYLTLK